jgi:multidrug efflux pump subunit AcrB
LVPMALGVGQGSEANIPLGRAVIGGQILATLLNFYLVPAMFKTFFGKKKAVSAVHAFHL